MTEILTTHYPYMAAIIMMMAGLYGVMVMGNLVKKLIALAVFQTSAFLLYIAAAYIRGAALPVYQEGVTLYINPLPHVLMLTAIVVGVSVLAVGLALVVQIRQALGTVEESEVLAKEEAIAAAARNKLQVPLHTKKVRRKKIKSRKSA